MFLQYLKKKNQEYFLKLCVYAALSNGVFAKEEEKMIHTYCKEMDLTPKIPDTSKPLENVIDFLKNNTSEMEKNIIFLEMLGLVKSDGIYDQAEKDFMDKIVLGLGLKECSFRKLDSLLDIYSVVYKQLILAIKEC